MRLRMMAFPLRIFLPLAIQKCLLRPTMNPYYESLGSIHPRETPHKEKGPLREGPCQA